MSGPGALCVALSGRRFFRRSPAALCVAAPTQRARRHRAPCSRVPGPTRRAPGSDTDSERVAGPDTESEGPDTKRVGALHRECRVQSAPGGRVPGPALFVSGPGALCVEPRRSLCRGPAVSVSGSSGSADLQLRTACRPGPALPITPLIRYRGPAACATHPARRTPIYSVGPKLRFASTHPHPCPATHPAREPSGGPQAPSSDPRAAHPHSPFPGQNPKPYCLGEISVEHIIHTIHHVHVLYDIWYHNFCHSRI